MKSLIVAAGVIAYATSAQAEAWTCSYILDGSKEPVLHRFELSPPDLIETKYNEHYRVLQNNSYGLVATEAISGIEEGQQKATVGAHTVVINKETGEFRWHMLITGTSTAYDALNTPVKGKCIKG
jgi:hypothetical protein